MGLPPKSELFPEIQIRRLEVFKTKSQFLCTILTLLCNIWCNFSIIYMHKCRTTVKRQEFTNFSELKTKNIQFGTMGLYISFVKTHKFVSNFDYM